jgi:hypothetical protein
LFGTENKEFGKYKIFFFLINKYLYSEGKKATTDQTKVSKICGVKYVWDN